MLKVAIILGSVRPGRRGEPVAKWVYEVAKKRRDAEFELVELIDFNLTAFYSYATPEPSGFRDAPILPATAFYSEEFSNFLLLYDDVRSAANPEATVLEFLQSTYEAAARLGQWDRDALEFR